MPVSGFLHAITKKRSTRLDNTDSRISLIIKKVNYLCLKRYQAVQIKKCLENNLSVKAALRPPA